MLEKERVFIEPWQEGKIKQQLEPLLLLFINMLPQPSNEALATSSALVKLIRAQINIQGDWMPFSQYMNLVLYAPHYGYYTGGCHKIGLAGDFITAPTLTPLFGQTLATQIAQVLPQTAGNIYEFGAGTGTLAVDILAELANLGIQVNAYYVIDVSPELISRQTDYVQKYAPAQAHLLQHLSELPEIMDGVILGNEVLDAIACEVISWQEDGIWQRGVKWGEQGFEWTQQKRSQGLLWEAAQKITIETRPYTSELHLAQQAFILSLSEKLQCGAMIFIDYGFEESQYYCLERNTGTLIGHYRHHSIHNPFYLPGLCDLTCHINFTAIAEAAVDSGLDLIGYASQAYFLINLGLPERLLQIGEPESKAFIQAALACQKLLAPQEMGEVFKVMAMGKNVDVDWQGFASGDICYKL